MSDRQLSIPGLPVPGPKTKKPTIEERLANLESRMLALELEESLLQILMEKGDGKQKLEGENEDSSYY